MINFARNDRKDNEIIFNNTATKLKMNSSIIEKDFWVCYILDYLFNRFKYKDSLIFKGGTSLSKAYNVIKRFSEDIDLILEWETLGYSDNYLYQERSNNSQNKINKELIKKTSDFLSDDFLKELKRGIKKELGFIPNIKMDENDKDGCTINFYYPSIFKNKYTREEIRLEIGPLAERHPSHNVKVKSYVADVYPQIFKDPSTNIRTIDVERTFWEKIIILNTVAIGYKNNRIPPRYARHYYDVYCLANSKYKEDAFKKKELLEVDAKFKNKFYYAQKASYDTIHIGNIKLVPNSEIINDLKKDYAQMNEMFFGEYPTFNDILKTLKKLEIDINNL